MYLRGVNQRLLSKSMFKHRAVTSVCPKKEPWYKYIFHFEENHQPLICWGTICQIFVQPQMLAGSDRHFPSCVKENPTRSASLRGQWPRFGTRTHEDTYVPHNPFTSRPISKKYYYVWWYLCFQDVPDDSEEVK